MFRYKLRTLLIVLALGPPLLAAAVPPLVAWLQPESLILEAGSFDRRVLQKRSAASAQLVWRDVNGVARTDPPALPQRMKNGMVLPRP